MYDLFLLYLIYTLTVWYASKKFWFQFVYSQLIFDLCVGGYTGRHVHMVQCSYTIYQTT